MRECVMQAMRVCVPAHSPKVAVEAEGDAMLSDGDADELVPARSPEAAVEAESDVMHNDGDADELAIGNGEPARLAQDDVLLHDEPWRSRGAGSSMDVHGAEAAIPLVTRAPSPEPPMPPPELPPPPADDEADRFFRNLAYGGKFGPFVVTYRSAGPKHPRGGYKWQKL